MTRPTQVSPKASERMKMFWRCLRRGRPRVRRAVSSTRLAKTMSEPRLHITGCRHVVECSRKLQFVTFASIALLEPTAECARAGSYVEQLDKTMEVSLVY